MLFRSSHFDNIDRTDDLLSHAMPSGKRPSYGPAADGRIKPDLCGPFHYIYTTDQTGYNGYYAGNYTPECNDEYFAYTSAAVSVVAGAVGIVYQMYKENLFGNNAIGANPHASTVKAILIADAYQYEFSQATRYQQGWGLPDLKKSLDIGQGHFIVDEETALQTGQSIV